MSRYTICKEFHFAASHIIDGLPDGHKCGRLHGHNYRVILELSAFKLDEVGFVIDFGELSTFGAYLDKVMDHRHLNDIFDFPTTAEHIARHLFDIARGYWDEVSAVMVYETDKAWAIYRLS